MPLTLLRLAGKFSPPTVAVQYTRSSSSASRVYEMPLTDGMMTLSVSVIMGALKAEHAEVFAKVAIPDEKLRSVVLRVVEGYTIRRMQELQKEREALEAAAAERQQELEPELEPELEQNEDAPLAAADELPDLDEVMMALPDSDPSTADMLDEDIDLRASVNSFRSHGSRNSRDRYARPVMLSTKWFDAL
jgi:hypothetical protein